jgi:hypothetical protein
MTKAWGIKQGPEWTCSENLERPDEAMAAKQEARWFLISNVDDACLPTKASDEAASIAHPKTDDHAIR